MADGPNIDLIVPLFEEITAFYQAADQMGFHALWFTEKLFSHTWMGQRGLGLDQFSALAAAAAATSRIRLGTTAPIGVPRPPILSFATDFANLDRLSGGRLTLGLSQGDWPAEGVREHRRPRVGGRLIETITLLKRLWSEDDVSFKGSHYNLEKDSIDVRPVQAGGIAILVGGVTSASVNLAATLADGWVHPSGGIPGGAARGCDMVRRLASRAGRDPDFLELGKIIYLAIDNNRGRARRRIAPLLQSFYGGYNVDSWCAFGPPAECAAFIRGFLVAGITTVMLCLVPPDVEHLERLHREVVPLLR
ncbi:MAG: LLM class flavin-dependent oxidoreductase [Chloroflexi bacterium]|nr:LLM class flavin-dependent oxidoreductase [Chloroflexota bacterium]